MCNITIVLRIRAILPPKIWEAPLPPYPCYLISILPFIPIPFSPKPRRCLFSVYPSCIYHISEQICVHFLISLSSLHEQQQNISSLLHFFSFKSISLKFFQIISFEISLVFFFLFTAAWYSIVWMCHSLFNHLGREIFDYPFLTKKPFPNI